MYWSVASPSSRCRSPNKSSGGPAAAAGREKGEAEGRGLGQPWCLQARAWLEHGFPPCRLEWKRMPQAARWWVCRQCLWKPALAASWQISQAVELWTVISKCSSRKPGWEMGLKKHYNLFWGLLRVNEFSQLLRRTLMYGPCSQLLIYYLILILVSFCSLEIARLKIKCVLGIFFIILYCQLFLW